MKKRRVLEETPEALDENYVFEDVVNDAPDALSAEPDAPLDDGEPAVEPKKPKKKKGKKKKRADDEGGPAEDGAADGAANGDDLEQPEQASHAQQKTKRPVSEKKRQKLAEVKARSKEKKQEKFKAERVGQEIASRSAEEQAAWFATALAAEFGREMTAVELEELAAEEAPARFAALDGSEHTLEALPALLEGALGEDAGEKLGGAPEGMGSPTVVTVSSSGARAMDVLRALRPFGRTVKIGKLFAKHFKLEEQVAWLKQHPLRIAVGTPRRLEQLLGAGALSFDALELLLFDMAEDAKGFTVLDLHDTRRDALALYRRWCHPRVLARDARLALF